MIGKGVAVERAVIGRGAIVRGKVTGVAIRADCLAHDRALVRALAVLGWPLDACTLVALPARGSDRSFTRILHGSRSAILVQYGTRRSDNPLYAGHARFLLKHGAPVPCLLADLPDDRALVMEDVGDQSLLSLAGALTPARLERRYRAALDALLAIHAIPLRRVRRLRTEPAFSADVYRWERELMANHLLRNRFRMKKRTVSGILADLEAVARQLLRAPAVLVHRDAQSSNVMWHRGRPVLIDFQSMRPGPAAYDVASLLADPYVMLEPALQARLLAHYLSRSPSPDAVREFFWLAAVERLAQALGAFGRLSVLPGLSRFADHIPPAFAMMARALEHLPGVPHLKAFVGTP